MMLLLNRLLVSFKRCVRSPYTAVMAGIMILLSSISFLMPSSKSSAYIPVAILNLDGSREASSAVQNLRDSESVFSFYEVESEDEMYKDFASGNCSIGYIFPDKLIEKSARLNSVPRIRVVTTPASVLSEMATEEVFGALFEYIIPCIIKAAASEEGMVIDGDFRERAKEIFDEVMTEGEVYRLEELETASYGKVTREEKLSVPVYKFAGFFIWMAALLGCLSYLNDTDNKIYLRMGTAGRIYMGLILPLCYVLPVAAASLVSFFIAGIEFSFFHVAGYCVLSIVLSFLIGSVFVFLPGNFRRSAVFAAVLPTYLILSLVFGGILFNLASYSRVIAVFSKMFPPFLF